MHLTPIFFFRLRRTLKNTQIELPIFSVPDICKGLKTKLKFDIFGAVTELVRGLGLFLGWRK